MNESSERSMSGEQPKDFFLKNKEKPIRIVLINGEVITGTLLNYLHTENDEHFVIKRSGNTGFEQEINLKTVGNINLEN